MSRIVNNSRKCIDCSAPVARKVLRCVECRKIAKHNQGRYERTPEHREHLRRIMTGRKLPWWKGQKHKPETRRAMAAAWTPEMREAARLRGLRLAADPEWRLRCGSPGQKNSNWQGGRAQLPYSPGWARKVKQLAWERAKNCCELCGLPGYDTHHIDFEKDNHELDNLQVLCRKCHKGLHAEHLKNNKSHQDSQSSSPSASTPA